MNKTGKKTKVKGITAKTISVIEVVNPPEKRGFLWLSRVKDVLLSRAAVLSALFTIMLLSVFATMRDSVIGRIQEDILSAIKAPFSYIKVAHLHIDYTPYFLLNVIVIIICLVLILSVMSKKSWTTPVVDPKKINTGIVFTAAVLLYVFQVKFFLADKYYITQGVLYLALIVLLGFYFYRRDKAGNIPVTGIRLLEPGEKLYLFIFAAAMFALYIWDYTSWKYCFIGDEYMFYTYDRDIARGILPLKFFYETGVAGDHPVMASIYTGAIMKIFGTGLFGWKLNTAIVPVVTMIPLYIWLKLVFKKRVAMIGTVAFIFSAAMMAFARIPHDVVHAVFPFVLTLLLVELAIRKNSAFWSFAAGVVMALGCYSFYPSRLTALVAALYWFLHPMRRKYAVSNLITGLAIYAATVAFIFLNPAFADHMLVHSVFKGSEIGNPAERPLYMVMNYIITFFAFLYKPNMSHFIAGSTAEWITAIGALSGLVWCLMSFKKDWRARWLILSYAVLVFFIGAIVQYSYAPNTRVNFLAPMFSILAGVGLTRLIAAAVSFKKKPFTGYRRVTLAVVVMMMLSSLWYFYVYNPKVFPFTPESYIVKYMEEKAQKGKEYTMVTGEFIRDTLLPELYKFPKGFKCVGPEVFEKMLVDENARGKIFIFEAEILDGRNEMKGLVKKGATIYGYESAVIAYVFDFTDPVYYDGFRQLWLTGRTFLDLEEPEQPPMRAGGNAGPVTFDVRQSINVKKNIKTKFPAGSSYRYMTSAMITNYEAVQLKLNAGAGVLSDIAVSPDGLTIYIADGENKKIRVLSSKNGVDYSAVKTVNFYPERKGFTGFGTGLINKNEKYLYVCIDALNGGFLALDPDRGCVRAFDKDGLLKKQIISSSSIVGARSLRVSESGVMLACAVPGQNMVIVFTVTGEHVGNMVTSYGSGFGQLFAPTFMGFGGESGFYVVDSGNGRIQHFDDNYNCKQFYKIGTLPQTFTPQVLIYDKGKIPYFVTLQPLYNRLLLYPVNENRVSMLELKGIKGTKLTVPSMLASDAAGNIYIMDHKERTVVKVTLPKDVMNLKPITQRRRG